MPPWVLRLATLSAAGQRPAAICMSPSGLAVLSRGGLQHTLPIQLLSRLDDLVFDIKPLGQHSLSCFPCGWLVWMFGQRCQGHLRLTHGRQMRGVRSCQGTIVPPLPSQVPHQVKMPET
jgi:hypothetical protein